MSAARFTFAALCCLLATTRAQEKLEVEGPVPATIRLGDTARVMLRIEGRTADPRPPSLPQVPGLRMQLSAPSRTSYTMFDGRTTIERVGVQYQLTLQPQQEGTFTVPPFAIWTGTAEQMTPDLRLDVRKDLRGEELGWLDVVVEPQRVYVHEPIRIRVDFGIQPGLRLVQDVADRYRYFDVEVQAPWIHEFSGGERIDLPAPKGDIRLIVASRKLEPAAFESNHERVGRRWDHYSFERAFLPTRIGTIELSAPMLRYHVLLREGQPGIFGERRGQQAENYYVYGKPLTLEVLPIPEVGRPTPYYGAVGRFTIDASLDRDTVRVGSSVKLTLTVRGSGNFEFLRLPELDGLEGFHKLGEAEAVRDADKVVVTYDLLPLSADVRAVPPISWNYFDTTPGVEKFAEVRTPPLPLVVKPLENGETLAPLPEAAAKSVTPGVDDVFDLPPFEGPPQWATAVPAWIAWLAVLGPWAIAALASFCVAQVRRRAADPLGRAARGAGRACQRALQEGAEPLATFATYLGDRLGVPAAAVITPDLAQRLVAAGLDAAIAADVAAFVERGTAARYGGGSGVDAAAARDLLRRLEAVRFGIISRAAAPLLLLVVIFGASGMAPAQQVPPQVPDAAAAVTAYRAADWRGAAEAFGRAFETTGDRRYWQARGNCWFRLGDLPRALWAYENARLGRPRDAELLANLRLVRERLGIEQSDGGFVAEVTALRAGLSPTERVSLCAFGMLLAAGCLVFGWRRPGLRWIGLLVLLPAAWLAAEVTWLEPARPARAIALQKLAVVSEPRAGLEPVATVRPGVEVSVLGSAEGSFVRVLAGDRTGYAPREDVAVVQ